MPERRRIAVLTTARSDFGPLKRVIHHASEQFHLDLLVSGAHFLASRGNTLTEVEREFGQNAHVNLVPLGQMTGDIDTATQQVANLAQTQLQASEWFANNPCDALVFLGDRWDLWGVTLAAFMHGVPLAHISGGEVTEGAIDDMVRHAHSKLASLHFVAAQDYARNLSLMGEEDWRIAVVGECGLDLFHHGSFATVAEVRSDFGIDLELPTLLVTYHPSTLELHTSVSAQIESLLSALDKFSQHQILFTAPGVEQGSQDVLNAIQSFVHTHANARLVHHFGSRNYLAVLRSALAVVGNSSSGVVEAASFGVPAINIGQRQKNRLAAASVQHVGYEPQAIQVALDQALSGGYQAFARTCPNPYDPYGDGQNSQRIVRALQTALIHVPREKLRMKKFVNEVHPEQWNRLLAKDFCA